jgi:hypothetical protein
MSPFAPTLYSPPAETGRAHPPLTARARGVHPQLKLKQKVTDEEQAEAAACGGTGTGVEAERA